MRTCAPHVCRGTQSSATSSVMRRQCRAIRPEPRRAPSLPRPTPLCLCVRGARMGCRPRLLCSSRAHLAESWVPPPKAQRRLSVFSAVPAAMASLRGAAQPRAALSEERAQPPPPLCARHGLGLVGWMDGGASEERERESGGGSPRSGLLDPTPQLEVPWARAPSFVWAPLASASRCSASKF